MRTLSKFVAIAALIAGIGSVYAQMPDQGMDMQKMMENIMPAASDAASTKDFKTAHMKMMHSMDVKYSGNSDVDFVRGMIPHHQGAIDMAKVQLQHGKDPELRKLAEKIISDQEKEIAEMQAWLKNNQK